MAKTIQRISDTRTPQEKVRVNPDELDVEWCRIADDIYAAAEAVTDAEEALLVREARKVKVMTELDLEIRQAPEVYGLEKVTEPGVKSVIQGHEKVAAAEEKAQNGRIALMRAKNLVTGLMEKRRALENLVVLHGQNYFASPRDGTGAADSIRREKTADRVNGRLQKKG